MVHITPGKPYALESSPCQTMAMESTRWDEMKQGQKGVFHHVALAGYLWRGW